jgi:hypothetical protein
MRIRNRTGEQDLNPIQRATTNVRSRNENLQGMRNRGESLAEACDRAIARALSGDSEDFIQRSQQEGGQ